jgi:hypothetical protein
VVVIWPWKRNWHRSELILIITTTVWFHTKMFTQKRRGHSNRLYISSLLWTNYNVEWKWYYIPSTQSYLVSSERPRQ